MTIVLALGFVVVSAATVGFLRAAAFANRPLIRSSCGGVVADGSPFFHMVYIQHGRVLPE